MWSYMNYRKRSPELHEQSIFKLPGGVVTCWIVIIFFLCTIGVLALDEDTRKSLIVSPIWFIILIIGYFFAKKK